MSKNVVYAVYTEKRGLNVYETLEALGESKDAQESVTEISYDDYIAADRVVRYVNGEFVLGKSDEQKAKDETRQKIKEYKKYLNDTDYISNKLAEVADDESAYAGIKAKYKDTLEKRKQARKFIDENS